MRKFYLSLLSLLLVIPAWAQENNSIVKGSLCDIDGNPIKEISLVVLMNQEDSTAVKQQYVEDGIFEIHYLNPGKSQFLLYVSAYGYKSRFLDITKPIHELGNVILEPLAYALDGITITEKEDIRHSFNHGKDEFTIPRSIGEREFNLASLLTNIPGLEVMGESVTIIGLGAPTYTINGLKPRPGEIQNLKPRDIEKIVIDRMPSAKYDRTVVGIIDIITRKTLKDYLSLQLNELFNYQTSANNIAGFSLNHKSGKWSTYFNYDNSYSNSKLDMDYHTTIYADEVTYNKTTDSRELNQARVNVVTYSPRFQINESSFVDGQYTYSRAKTFTDYQNLLDFVNVETDAANSNSNSVVNNHDLIFRYSNRFSPTTNFVVNLGFSHYNDDDESDTHEKIVPEGEAEQITNTVNQSKFSSDVLTASAEYNFLISKKLRTGVGAELGKIWNRSTTTFTGGPRYDIETEESQATLYFNLSQTIKKFTYQLGLRGEYIYKKSNDEYENKNPLSILPSIGISYKYSDKYNFSLYFRRTTVHPTLRQLNPSLVYANKYEYAQGNPLLKSAINNDLSLKIGLPKNILFTFGYNYAENLIVQWFELTDDPKILNLTYRNFNNATTLKADLNWRANAGIYSFSITGSYKQTFSKTQSQHGTISNNKPKLSLFMQHVLRFTPNIRFTVSANYDSSYGYMHLNLDEKYSLNAALMFSLLKNTLNIQIAANNLLSNDIIENHTYSNISGRFRNITYPRYFGVGIFYNFNNFRELFKNSSNVNILKRAY